LKQIHFYFYTWIGKEDKLLLRGNTIVWVVGTGILSKVLYETVYQRNFWTFA